MEIEIRSSVEFQRLLEQLASELQEANIHFKLHRDLVDAAQEFATEYAQANAFWSLTVQAHLDVALFRLCKIYDQHARTLNLRNLLDTIKANLHIFDAADFRQRMKTNPFVDSLVADLTRPDAHQLEQDLVFVSEQNPAVKALVVWRNNYFSHRSPRHAIEQRSPADSHPLQMTEVDRLLTDGMNILNRYSGLFCANHYSTDIVGRDDYRSVLEAVREHIETVERRVQEEIARFESSQTRNSPHG